MNAKEFIKQYGWEISTRLQREMLGITEQVADSVAVWGQSEWDNLKQLVDAWELVNRFGGLFESKKYIDDRILPELSRSIELVESVNV